MAQHSNEGPSRQRSAVRRAITVDDTAGFKTPTVSLNTPTNVPMPVVSAEAALLLGHDIAVANQMSSRTHGTPAVNGSPDVLPESTGLDLRRKQPVTTTASYTRRRV